MLYGFPVEHPREKIVHKDADNYHRDIKDIIISIENKGCYGKKSK
jgi:hypothetical protein